MVRLNPLMSIAFHGKGFSAGQKVGHTMVNHGDRVCKYLLFNSRNDHDVVVYPDNDKVKVSATVEIYKKSLTLGC